MIFVSVPGKPSKIPTDVDFAPTQCMGYTSSSFRNPEAKVQRQVRRARRHELAASAAQPGVEDMSLSDSSNSEEDTGGVHDKCQKTITDLRAQLKSRDDEIANLRGKVERLESSVRDKGFGAAMLSAPANVKVADARVRFLTGFMTLAAFSFFVGS